MAKSSKCMRAGCPDGCSANSRGKAISLEVEKDTLLCCSGVNFKRNIVIGETTAAYRLAGSSQRKRAKTGTTEHLQDWVTSS